MGQITQGLKIFVFGGSAPVTIANAPWVANANAIYRVRQDEVPQGYLAYVRGAGFNTLTQLEKDEFYIIDASATFDLPGAQVEAGQTVFPIIGKMQVAVDGDSLDKGYLSTNPRPGTAYDASANNTDWLSRVAANLGLVSYGDFSNYAVSGQYVTQMESDAQQQVFSTLNADVYDGHLLVVGGGINDVEGHGDDAQTVYNNIKAYHLAARAAGWSTCALTHTAGYKDYGIGAAAANIVREQLDEMIRVGWRDDFGASVFVDLAKDPIIGIYGAPDYAYYNADGQHFKDAGYAYKGSLIQPAIEAFKNGNTYGKVSLAAPVINFTSNAATSVTVNWTASAGASKYIVWRGLQEDGSDKAQIFNNNGLFLYEEGLTENTTYFYFIQAVDVNGIKNNSVISTASNVPSAGGSLPAPGNLRQFKADAGYNADTGVWSDQAIGIDTASPVNTGAKPTVTANSINGLPSLRFNQTPLKTAGVLGITGNNPRTYMAVVKINSYVTDGNAAILGVGTRVYTPADGYPLLNTADLIFFGNKLTYNTNGSVPQTGVVIGNTWAIITLVVVNGTNVTITWNATRVTNQSGGSDNLPSARLTIGGGNYEADNTNFNNYDAEIAEVIIRSDADQVAYNTNMAYLKTKYGFTF